MEVYSIIYTFVERRGKHTGYWTSITLISTETQPRLLLLVLWHDGHMYFPAVRAHHTG
jgi:hypothetical protein